MDISDDDIRDLFYESDTTLLIRDAGAVLVKENRFKPQFVGLVALIENHEVNIAFKQMYLLDASTAKQLGQDLLAHAALVDPPDIGI